MFIMGFNKLEKTLPRPFIILKIVMIGSRPFFKGATIAFLISLIILRAIFIYWIKKWIRLLYRHTGG
jgi:hypothetical protein